MNPNYRTLNNDIGMMQRTNNGWDLWFDNGDLVKAEDFHSLQVGIIIACLTSWNYMNRYGNPTYEVFGNRAYQLLKANKSSMVQYKIEQFFLECLKRMRRVYDVVSLTVSEVPYDPYKYHVEFEVISINNQLVDGSFTISTDTSKSSSYIEYITYMPYASNENDLVIDLWLKNEYGGGLDGEILYMYLKRGDDDYEFRGVVGQTDENGYLRVTYNPWDDETSETRHSDDVNIIYFDFHGNTTYNPSTSKRTSFKTELFTYHIEFIDNDIATSNNYQYLKLRLTKESLDNHEIYPMDYTTITIIGTDGMIYDATTDANGEVEVRVNILEDVIFTASYNNASDYVNVSIIKQTPTIDFSPSKYELFVGDTVELRAVVTDESDNPIKDIEVTFKDGEEIIGNVTTGRDGVAVLSTPLVVVDTYHFTASVVGDNFYESVETDEVTVVASKHMTDISLEVSASPLVVDKDIVFTAMVIEEDAITGEQVGLYGLDVEFSDDGGNVLGTVSIENGVAMFSTNELGIGEHTIYAQVVETQNYCTSMDSVDIRVLPHDYSLELTGAITGIYDGRYIAQVSVALYDHDVLFDGMSYGEEEEDMLLVECDETGDEWIMETSDSTKIFETKYTPFGGDDTTALTFIATWGNLTSTLNIGLPNPSTKILAKFEPHDSSGRIFGYLYDDNDQPIPSQEIHISHVNLLGSLKLHIVTTDSDGYFTFQVAHPDTAIDMTYGGDYIYSSSSKTLNPRDSETWDDIQMPNANQN